MKKRSRKVEKWNSPRINEDVKLLSKIKDKSNDQLMTEK